MHATVQPYQNLMNLMNRKQMLSYLYYIYFVKSFIDKMSRHTKIKDVINKGMEEDDYDYSDGEAELSKGKEYFYCRRVGHG